MRDDNNFVDKSPRLTKWLPSQPQKRQQNRETRGIGGGERVSHPLPGIGNCGTTG